jgi:type III pantothenate kinase
MGGAAKGAFLAVDVGNTAIKVAVVADGRVGPVKTLASPAGADGLGELPALPAVVCSVVAPGLEEVLRGLEVATGRAPRLLGRDLTIPMRSAYRTPQTLGADRLVAALAAWEELRRAVIVCDAGSALTVDVVDTEGVFLGGAIAPGIASLGTALKAAAPALDSVAPDSAATYPGATSEACCRIGVTAAARGLLRELLEEALARVGAESPVVVTGGDGAQVLELWKRSECLLRPHLVLTGIAHCLPAARGSKS